MTLNVDSKRPSKNVHVARGLQIAQRSDRHRCSETLPGQNHSTARPRTAWGWLLFLLCIVTANPVLAQDDDEDAITPGLIAEYQTVRRKGKSVLANGGPRRIEPDISFVWDRVPTQQMEPDKEFAVTFTSSLLVQQASKYRFHVVVAGDVQIELDDKPVLRATSEKSGLVAGEAFDLAFGDHKIVVRYRSRPKGTGTLKLYWSSDAFPLEPVPSHLFSIEDPPAWLPLASSESRHQHTALRCARCHSGRIDPGTRSWEAAPFEEADPAPSLGRIRGALSKDWIVAKLTTKPTHESGSKMPWFELTLQSAEDVAAFLIAGSKQPKLERPSKTGNIESDRKAGKRLVQTLGCLACHQLGEPGTQGAFSGGQLAEISKKRSVDWVHTWLRKPESLNADHRMPVIELSKDERRQLSVFLGGDLAGLSTPPSNSQLQRGEAIVREARCANCHRIPGIEPSPRKSIATVIQKRLKESLARSRSARPPVDFQSSCVSPLPDHKGPSYPQAIRGVDGWHKSVRQSPTAYLAGQYVLTRNNCIACHQRDRAGGNLDVVGQLLKSDRSLRAQSQGLIPPSLTAIGDKLKDDALRKAIAGEQRRRLPWLSVRMPKFKHSKAESDALASYLVAHDRVPTNPDENVQGGKSDITTQTLVEGQTLIGSGGFSCIACHKAGKYEPRNVALGTRGSDLLMPGERMRKEFFLRWVRSPTRIVPGMEMPSITKPVKGVLGDDIHTQLAAAWDVLNDKNFTVPTDPGSVEQFVRVEPDSPARIIRDVFTDPTGDGYIARPLVIGLHTGHNLMFDLDQFGLRHWWFGDVARQRTEGKSWYWDVAGIKVSSQTPGSDVVLRSPEGEIIEPTIQRATAGHLLNWKQSPTKGMLFEYTLNFNVGDEATVIRVAERIDPYERVNDLTGWRRSVSISEPPKGHTALLRHITPDGFEVFTDADGGPIQVGDGTYLQFHDKGYCTVAFSSDLSRTDSKSKPQPQFLADRDGITSVPGFTGERLPLPTSIMPTSMAWRHDGTFVFTSLKGHVFLAKDSDRDGLPDTLSVFEEGLAAPFGILRTGPEHGNLLVAHKPEVILLSGKDRAEERKVVSTGWGHSDNYHDWTCGLVRDSKGDIYFGLGSDYSQPKRPKDRSLWRGAVLRLTADGKTEPVSWSFRYPVGFAIDSKDRVFVTDNQGVQNTYNEVNHVQMGKHYGVPSRHEPNPDQPETTPAIRVPHPWVRSMNAIVFLPDGHKSGFGGHLIGCEYDTHMLIRMSFQDVGDVVQGASYYFSKPGLEGGGNNFVGPICAAVHENGDIYIGSIHDSGWLGGRNTGAIERIRFTGNLPNGIRELRATPDGFEIDFVKPLPADKLRNAKNYSISGYTRNWKGSYATPDAGRHTLNITSATVTNEGRTVRLSVKQKLREEHVYEVTVNAAKDLFPATGHYTMKRVPR